MNSSSRKRFLVLGVAMLFAVSARAADPDKLLPNDAEGVFVINVRQLLDSPVVKKFALQQMKAALAKDEKVARPLAAAGIDPLKDVDTILVTGSLNPANANKALIVVRGRFDLEKVNAAADDLSKQSDGKLKIHKEGNLRIYETRNDDKPAYMAFKDKNTLVASGNRDYTVEVATEKTATKPGKALITALSKIDPKDSIYLALVITDDMKKVMSKNPQTQALAPKLEAITGGIALSDFLLASILIHTTDEESADQVKMLVNQLKPFLAVLAQANEEAAPLVNELIANLKVASDKKAVSISIKLNQDLVEKLKKQTEKPQKE